jgi:NAD(P)-dependent dehydrogenase (short-subunit alcohol dehydrogenase family)
LTGLVAPATLFVVSGGARGVTARCVVELARRYRCRFLLLGRTAPQPEPGWAAGCADEAGLKRRIAADLGQAGGRPTPAAIGRIYEGLRASREIAATLDAVAAAGGQAEYLAADVLDAEGLADALRPALTRLGPARGLIHGAGQLADRPIERKSAADFDRVVGPKLRGLSNLLRVVPPDTLEYLILFSSAAGFFGNPGQSDYALANEALNRVAHRLARLHPACRVLAPNWGPWDGGMVTPELKRLFDQRGIAVIPPDAGARALVELIEAPARPVQVLVGDRLGTPPARLGQPRSHRLHRCLTLEANPFLRDHVIGGRPVLPIVCAFGWIGGAAEGLYPGYRLFRGEELKVFKGIVFEEGTPDRYVLDLAELSRDGDESVTLEGVIWSGAPDGPRARHYGARVTLVREPPPPPRYEAADLREDARARDGEAIYGDGTLFHGPAFRGVARLLNADERRLTVRIALPPVPVAVQGQFPVGTFNPYVADAQFQSLVLWTRLLRGAASLPLLARVGELFRPLPFDRTLYVSTEVRSASEHALSTDTITHDESGVVYSRVLGAEVTISPRLNALFRTAAT